MAHKDKQEIIAMVMALLAAFVFWAYVMGEKNPPRERVIRNVPVTLVNVENIEQANLALMPKQEYSVDLTITGKALDVFQVSAADFKLEADMGGYLKKGDNNIIPVQVKESPKGINVVTKAGYPYTVKVKLDSLLIKSVPVVVNVKGNAKEGFGNNQPVARPSEVLISGPATYVGAVNSVIGQIDISGIDTDIKETIPVKAQDKDGKVIQDVEIEPKNVDVVVPVKPSKEVPVTIKTTGALSADKILKSIKSKTERVLVIGDREEIDKINSIETQPLDLASITKSQTKELNLNLPKNVAIGGNLKTVSVDIVIEGKIDKSFSVPLKMENEDTNYNYTYSANTIEVVINGTEAFINSIDPKTITAAVDLKGLGEGSHTISVKLGLPEGAQASQYTPQKITVTITKK